MKKDKLENLRTAYTKGQLLKGDMKGEPMSMMIDWFTQALKLDIYEANAMSLSTVNKDGQPSSRIVLLKEIDQDGYVFYSNYYSRKGKDLDHNSKAALLFFWKDLEQQVRIEGKIEKLSEERSKEYFQSRPKGSQVGSWASPQSKIIADRSALDDRLSELNEIYKDREVLPKPRHWGGYILHPNYYEFWQGRENRLHDRFEYRLEGDEWNLNRLAP